MVERVAHGPPPPGHFPLIVHRPGHHEDVFITSLQAEVSDLKHRQGDYNMLMDVFKQLETKYHEAMLDISKM